LNGCVIVNNHDSRHISDSSSWGENFCVSACHTLLAKKYWQVNHGIRGAWLWV
jgi:hypothetical protein